MSAGWSTSETNKCSNCSPVKAHLKEIPNFQSFFFFYFLYQYSCITKIYFSNVLKNILGFVFSTYFLKQMKSKHTLAAKIKNCRAIVFLRPNRSITKRVAKIPVNIGIIFSRLSLLVWHQTFPNTWKFS